MKKWCLMIVMFCFLLVLPGTAFAVDSTGWMGPDQQGDASGAHYAENTWFNVEAGQTFWIGDYFFSFVNYETNYGSELPLRYRSDNKAVAFVGANTGKVKTRKAGTAVITATYEGKDYTCTLHVKKKGALKSTSTYKKMNQAAAALSKFYNKKLSTKNSTAVFKACAAYFKAVGKNKKARRIMDGEIQRSLSVPLSIRAADVMGGFHVYLEKRTPFLYQYSYKVSSVTGKAGSSTAVVTLPAKVSVEAVNAMRLADTWSSRKYTFGKTCNYYGEDLFRVTYYNQEEDENYEMELDAKLTLKAGTRKITCQLYTEENGRKKVFKLKKGMTLSTISEDFKWKNEKTCRIK